MSNLTYATITILIIWGGIFFYLLRLDAKVRRLERSGTAPFDPDRP